MSGNQWHPVAPSSTELETPQNMRSQDAIKALISQIDREIASCRDELEVQQERLHRLERARASLAGEPLRPQARARVGSHVAGAGPALARITKRRERKGSIASLVREGARAILHEAGRPLNRVQLLERLQARGISLNARQPAKQIGKIMWQSDEFQHLADGYWFRDGPLPTR